MTGERTGGGRPLTDRALVGRALVSRALVTLSLVTLSLVTPAVGAVMVASASAPAGATGDAARATSPACTDSWASPVSGDWAAADNWSTGVVPTAADVVCIQAPGTYTVAVSGGGAAGVLLLGGATSGTQTLLLQGLAYVHTAFSLSAATGSTIEPGGVLEMSAAARGSIALNGGPGVTLVDSGMFDTVGPVGSTDYLSVSLASTAAGAIVVSGAATDQFGGTTTTNGGAGSISAGATLTLSGSSNFVDAGGTLADAGTLWMSGGTFTQSGGSESGNAVQMTGGAALADSTGAGSFSLTDGGNPVSGTIATGQVVTVFGVPGASTVAELNPSGVTNNGTLVLDSLPNGDSASVNGGTLTNNGTVETTGAVGGLDHIGCNLTNDPGGTVTVAGGSTLQDVGTTTTTNNGTFDITVTGNLSVSNGSNFVDSGGVLSNGGSFLQIAGTFTQSGGSESGNPVQVEDFGNLVDKAGGASFNLENSADTVSGTIPKGQTVTVVGSPQTGAAAQLAKAGVTNKGTFVLDSTRGGDAATVEGGPLTNRGTFETLDAASNTDYIEVNLTNVAGGVVDIDGTFNAQSAGSITNQGQFSVGPGAALVLANTPFTDGGGTLTNAGVLSLNGATFTKSGGVGSGNPVQLTGTTAFADSAGAGAFDLLSASHLVSGTIPSGQTVTLRGLPGVGASAALAAAGVTNDGTLVLDAQPGGGPAALTGGPLTNNGTLRTVDATTNVDSVSTNVDNTAGGTVDIEGATTNQVGSATLNDGTVSVGAAGDLELINNATFVDGGGTLANGGTVDVNGGSFTQAGTVESGNPVNLVGVTALIDSAGAGSFDLIDGNDPLSGTIPAGQTVTVLGVPGVRSTAVLDPLGVTNDGTLALDAQPGAGSVSVTGGPLTNTGTFATLEASTASDTVGVSLTNAPGGTVRIGGLQTVQSSGTVLTNSGTLDLLDGVDFEVSNRATVAQLSTGTFSATVDANSGSASLLDGGLVALAGTLAVTTVGSPPLGTTYPLITAASPMTGQFAAFDFGDLSYTVLSGNPAVLGIQAQGAPRGVAH